jgi:hypothetical protein
MLIGSPRRASQGEPQLDAGAPIDDEAPKLATRLRQGIPALKVLPFVAVVAVGLHGRVPWSVGHTPEPDEAVVRALALEGIDATSDDVLWIDPPTGRLRDTIRGTSRAIVRAYPKDETNHDIYLVRARRSPEGRVVAVESIHRLTKTSGVDETRPVIDGEWLAFTTVQPSTTEGGTTGVELFDLSGEDQQATADWKKLQKIQNALTNLQSTGSILGVKRRRYTLEPPATNATIAWIDGKLDVVADVHHVVIDRSVDDPIDGKAYARFERVVKGKPGDIITWTVDRVRAVPWLGPETIEFLEYHAFKTRDWLKRHFSEWFGEDVAKEVADNVGSAQVKPSYTDPEIGWPPAPLKPILPGAPLPNEGVWMSLEDDPFVGKNPNVPSAFVQTFVRTDPQRVYATVYITMWDPRQVALHFVAGTVEPVSATGEVGTGQIPRTPEVLKNVVAGFNGGFQAVHFEGGMQVSGAMYLPPKPYAATAAELVDGTTAIGTWPGNLPDVPDEILSFRQNLTPLVRDGVINPYHQVKWGGTPPGTSDAIHTTRSGICLTNEGFVGYFFGFEMSEKSLGAGMVAANCRTGMHLDMNAGHTGFEFYRVAENGMLPPLDHFPVGTWEAEGIVPQLEGWSFRARRMIKGMPHMLFPRYIGRDGRDFMYLTLRNVLPGANLLPHHFKDGAKEEGEGVWKVKGLPQHGFPYAIALTTLRPDANNPSLHAQILKIDPRAVRPTADAQGDESDKTVVTFGGANPAKPGAPSLWLATGSFAIGSASPGPSAVPLFGGMDPQGDALATASAMLGVTDDDGTLIMTFGDADGAGPALAALLKRLGCSQTMVVPKTIEPRLGGSLGFDLELAKNKLALPAVTLVRGEAPSARPLFPDTPIVPPEVWMPLQAKRIRYFGKNKVRPGVVPAPPPAWMNPPTPPPSGTTAAKPSGAPTPKPPAPKGTGAPTPKPAGTP